MTSRRGRRERQKRVRNLRKNKSSTLPGLRPRDSNPSYRRQDHHEWMLPKTSDYKPDTTARMYDRRF